MKITFFVYLNMRFMVNWNIFNKHSSFYLFGIKTNTTMSEATISLFAWENQKSVQLARRIKIVWNDWRIIRKSNVENTKSPFNSFLVNKVSQLNGDSILKWFRINKENQWAGKTGMKLMEKWKYFWIFVVFLSKLNQRNLSSFEKWKIKLSSFGTSSKTSLQKLWFINFQLFTSFPVWSGKIRQIYIYFLNFEGVARAQNSGNNSTKYCVQNWNLIVQ
jgi:hypothetical protein